MRMYHMQPYLAGTAAQRPAPCTLAPPPLLICMALAQGPSHTVVWGALLHAAGAASAVQIEPGFKTWRIVQLLHGKKPVGDRRSEGFPALVSACWWLRRRIRHGFQCLRCFHVVRGLHRLNPNHVMYRMPTCFRCLRAVSSEVCGSHPDCLTCWEHGNARLAALSDSGSS